MLNRNRKLLCLITGFMVGLVVATGAAAAPEPYTFNLDHFVLSENQTVTVEDNFNDNNINTALWEIYDPTVVESGSMISFSNPGSLNQLQLGTLQVQTEMSYIHGHFTMENGDGNYTATATWQAIIPGSNQYYVMNLSSDDSQGEPDENMVIGVANFDAAVADFFNLSAGPTVFFGRSQDVNAGDFQLQSYAVTEEDMFGNIVLQLAFDDDSELFSGSFSLDGGASFDSESFTDIGSTGKLLNGVAELTLGGESWQVVPVPPTVLLLFSGLAFIGAGKTIRSGLIRKG